MSNVQQARDFLAGAELIHSAETVIGAVKRVADDITAELSEANPVLLCVMSGGGSFAGHLMTLLQFPLDYDSVVHSGSGSLRLVCNGAGSTQGDSLWQAVSLTTGAQYTLSFWYLQKITRRHVDRAVLEQYSARGPKRSTNQPSARHSWRHQLHPRVPRGLPPGLA